MIPYSAEIALNRFGMGAGKNDLSIVSKDPHSWLMDQVKPLVFKNAEWSSKTAIQILSDFYEQKKKRKNHSENSDMTMSPIIDRKTITRQAIRTAEDTLIHALKTPHSFQTRLLDFFSNHFSVTANNLIMQGLAPTLEREAIAPHLAGRFSDLLIAVETHPAMIIYLNNEQSAGPNSNRVKKNRGVLMKTWPEKY